MQKKIRANVLRVPQGINPLSIERAQELVLSFTKHLRTLGHPELAAAKVAAETGARVETKSTKDKDK